MKRMSLPLALAAAVAVSAFVAAAGKPAEPAKPPADPRRIVSIVPGCTELLYAVGAGDRVVGVTEYCTWPPEAARKEKVGSLVLNHERIAALRPDLVVSSEDLAAPSNAALRKAGYPVLCVDPRDFAGIAAALRSLGRAVGCAEGGERAAVDLERRVAELTSRLAGAATRPTVYLEASSQPHAAGPGMTGDELIRLAGGRNVITESFAGRWVPVSWEAVLARDPEVVVVVHDYEPGPEARPGYASMRAVKSGRVHRFDKNHFMYPTPRLLLGFEELARALHPECFDAAAK